MDGLATAESLIVEAGPSITSPAQQPDSESYVYEELNPRGSIRLLQLAPGRPDDPLEGTIVTVCPENVDQIRYKGSAKYRAVSYTWYEEENGSTIGKAEASKEIFCQGKSLPISRNLYNLLKRLRENEPYEKYWIDQICIDQGNEQEKEHQITLMRQIYQDAEFVIFWIGEENEDTGKVFDLVEKLAAIFISVQKSLQPLPGEVKS